MALNRILIILLVFVLASCVGDRDELSRPRDVWAFRSVLDRKPRMLTLALDSTLYAAYDLTNCTIYKIWRGGVDLQGAAYTDKKNVQPVSWGKTYDDSLHRYWSVEKHGVAVPFKIKNKGYRFDDKKIFIAYQIMLETGDMIRIEEYPEFVSDAERNPGLQRTFTASEFPADIAVKLLSPDASFQIKPGTTSILTASFNPIPPQQRPVAGSEYDHRGRYYMEKSDCFTCHEVNRATVGPSFEQVAAKYADEENAGLRLLNKVKEGGSGVWGNKVMNAHPSLSETEIRAMLDYVMSLAPKTGSVQEVQTLPLNKTKPGKPGFGRPLESVHPSFDVQTIRPANFKPKVGGLAFKENGNLLVTTWDSIGAVYELEGVQTGDTNKIKVVRIASGLAEPLGIEVVDGEIYVLQKQELTRLIDSDGDGVTDVYEAVCNDWGVTGDFHEFAFGLTYKDGFFYATLSMAMRLMSTEKQQPDRGKTIRIAKDGSFEPVNYGLRTPNGIGKGVDGEIFVTDNQGEWVPANKLVHVKEGEYHGMRWGHLDSTPVPEVALPAVWLPEDEIGNSPSEPILITGGIYKGQMLHGDVTYGGIQRDFLEKVGGEYQGAVFRFTQGLEAGINRMRWGPDGALYVGGVGMVGGWSWKEKQYGLQRLQYNGKPVFDMLAIRSKSDGFEIEFTEPVADDIEIKEKDLILEQWWYLPTADYGGPKKDLEKIPIKNIALSSDRRKLYVYTTGALKSKRIVYFRLPAYLKSEGGRTLWNGESWYTLNKISKEPLRSE